jgi:hypothetical protein
MPSISEFVRQRSLDNSLGVELTDAEFQVVNYCIRMADQKNAIKTVIDVFVAGLAQHMSQDWLRKVPNNRREDMYHLLKRAAIKIDLMAERLATEIERMQ